MITALHRSSQFSPAQIEAVQKDVHLIAASTAIDKSVLLSNRAILSMDEVMRGLLCKLATETRVLDRVQWANPHPEFELLRSWLVNGELPTELWQLGGASQASTGSRSPAATGGKIS